MQLATHAHQRIVVVTGATGVIGPVLVQRLVARGYTVRVLARRAVPSGLLPRSVEIIFGDIAETQTAAAAVQDADCVFHLAAKLHISNPGPALRDEYRRVNVEGTRRILDAALAADVQRLVFFSTIAVYGATQRGDVLTEDSVASANTLYAATKREAEMMVLGARRRDGTPLGVVLRVAGVYGPRIKGNYRELVRWLSRGFFVSVGSGLNRRTLVHDQDVAAAAVLAAEHPAAAGMIFNVTDGAIHTFREIVDAISSAIGRAPARLRVPYSAAHAAASVTDRALRLGGRAAIAQPLVEKMTEDLAVSGQRIQQTLGFKPEFDLLKGWRATIPLITDR